MECPMTLLVTELCVLLVGSTCGFFWMAERDRLTNFSKNTFRFAFVVFVGLALSCYVRFGAFHNLGSSGSHNFHFHEIFHYYLGAKYYKEWGSYDFYNCVLIALEEIGNEEPQRAIVIDQVRSMKDKLTFVPASLVRQDLTRLKSKFSSTKWEKLKDDLGLLRSVIPMNDWWQTALQDCGFNPSPAWMLFGGAVAQLLPLNDQTVFWLGYFDFAILLLCACLLGRELGVEPAFVFLVVLGTSYLAGYSWTGGSFFRHTELGFLTWAICCLRRGRLGLAGVLFGIAGAIRVFPLFFLAGALLPLLRSPLENDRRLRATPLICGAGLSVIACILISSFFWGPGKWVEWANNISGHKNIFFANHVGLKKIATFTSEVANQDFHGSAGDALFASWNKALTTRWERHQLPWLLFAGTFCTFVGYCSLRLSPPESALMFGSSLLVCFSIPANYYLIYLAVYAALLMAEPGAFAMLRFLILCGFLVGIDYLPVFMPDDILRSVHVSLLFVATLGLLATTCLCQSLCLRSERTRSITSSVLIAIAPLILFCTAGLLLHSSSNAPSLSDQLPASLLGEGSLVDSIDVGNEDSEKTHHWDGNGPKTNRRLLDLFGNVIDDDGRSNFGVQRFQVSAGTGKGPLTLVFRSDVFFDVSFEIRVDGTPVSAVQRGRCRSMFEYLIVHLPQDQSHTSDHLVELKVTRGATFSLFYVWAVEGLHHNGLRSNLKG